MSKKARFALISALTVSALAGMAPPAQADHHFMLIREYFPGTAANMDREDAFVELQMWSSGQQETGGHHIDLYGPGPAGTPTTHTLASAPVGNGDSQRTVLIGGPDVTGRDYTETIGQDGNPAGGAICFRSNEGFGVIDCVEWGVGNDTINAGTPVAGAIPDESSITRSIAPGCASLLEPGDDTNNSNTDFAVTAMPTPRPNATAPTEGPCRTVTFTVVGQGTVVGSGINCPGDCSQTYPNHATEAWQAMPDSGQTFLSWTACPSGSGNPLCTIPDLTSNHNITANFSGATQPPPGGGGSTTPTTPAPPKKKCKKGQKLKKGKCVKKKRKKK